jgi:hypothetical protein
VVDQHLTHHAGGDGEELAPLLPLPPPLLAEPQVGLVDESRGLERVLLPLAAQPGRRDRPQIVVDEGCDAPQRLVVPPLPGDQQLGDV